jgi:hypothetical protein
MALKLVRSEKVDKFERNLKPHADFHLKGSYFSALASFKIHSIFTKKREGDRWRKKLVKIFKFFPRISKIASTTNNNFL